MEILKILTILEKYWYKDYYVLLILGNFFVVTILAGAHFYNTDLKFLLSTVSILLRMFDPYTAYICRFTWPLSGFL